MNDVDSPFLPPGMAALHEAVLSGNLDCVKLLVKYGADIHQKDENGWTPLHMACSDGHADIARSEFSTSFFKCRTPCPTAGLIVKKRNDDHS